MVRRFLHLRDNGAKQDTIISSYWDHPDKGNITDVDIRVTVRQAVILLDLEKNEIPAHRVGTHSLRAGGAVALKFAGADHDNIKKMGTRLRNTQRGGPARWPLRGNTLI